MIVATIILAIFTWGVVVFGLRNAQTRQDVNRTLPALMTFGLLAILTALFALGDYLDAVLPDRLDPVASQAEIDALALNVGDPLLIVGVIIERVEYLTSESVSVALTDGNILVNGSGFIAGHWDRHEEETRYLDPGAEVVILASLPPEGSRTHARMVFQGTVDEFRDYVPRFAIVPVITMVSSLLLAVLCFGLPVLYRRRIAQK